MRLREWVRKRQRNKECGEREIKILKRNVNEEKDNGLARKNARETEIRRRKLRERVKKRERNKKCEETEREKSERRKGLVRKKVRETEEREGRKAYRE